MNIVFSFGTPKSGTTFLQMILNQHPEISCPGEHQLVYFFDELPKLIARYNHILQVIDDRKGCRLSSPFQAEDMLLIIRRIVEIAAKRGARDRWVKWHGISDNSILKWLDAYWGLFPTSKFIYIVRDPRSVAVSSWHHNHRVESDFLDRAVNLEKWSADIGRMWHQDISAVLHYQKSKGFQERLMICKYESLKIQHHAEYRRIFDFLDVDAAPDTIENIMNSTGFERFRDGKFFRKAAVEGWREELSHEAVAHIEKRAGKKMKNLGYELVTA